MIYSKANGAGKHSTESAASVLGGKHFVVLLNSYVEPGLQLVSPLIRVFLARAVHG